MFACVNAARRSLTCAPLLGLLPGWVAAQSSPRLYEGLSVVGQTIAVTGPFADLSAELQKGATANFSVVNAAGGVHGRRIEVVTKDDGYVADHAGANALEFADIAFCLFNSFGTPPNEAIIPIAERAGTPVLAPYTGALSVRDAALRMISNIRASYSDDAERLVRHLHTIGVRRSECPMTLTAGLSLLKWTPWVFVLIWSSGFVVARYGMPFSPPMKFLALRYALSVFIFALWAFAARAAFPAKPRQWLHLAFMGVLMHGVYLGGVWTAVKLGMDAGLISLLVALQPVLTAIWLFSRGNRGSTDQWAGLSLSLLGLLMVVGAKLGQGEVSAGNLVFALIALMATTTGTLYQIQHVDPCDVRSANLIQLAAAFAVLAPLAMLEPEPMRWVGPEGWNMALLGAMGWSVLGMTLGGSSLLYLLIQHGAATSVASLFYLVPPTTALMAAALFGEPITVVSVLGTALTAVGVALVVKTRS